MFDEVSTLTASLEFQPIKNIKTYQRIESVRRKKNRVEVTFSILVEKFLNLYECIFITIKIPQAIAKTKVYNQMYTKNTIKIVII